MCIPLHRTTVGRDIINHNVPSPLYTLLLSRSMLPHQRLLINCSRKERRNVVLIKMFSKTGSWKNQTNGYKGKKSIEWRDNSRIDPIWTFCPSFSNKLSKYFFNILWRRHIAFPSKISYFFYQTDMSRRSAVCHSLRNCNNCFI